MKIIPQIPRPCTNKVSMLINLLGFIPSNKIDHSMEDNIGKFGANRIIINKIIVGKNCPFHIN